MPNIFYFLFILFKLMISLLYFLMNILHILFNLSHQFHFHVNLQISLITFTLIIVIMMMLIFMNMMMVLLVITKPIIYNFLFISLITNSIIFLSNSCVSKLSEHRPLSIPNSFSNIFNNLSPMLQ